MRVRTTIIAAAAVGALISSDPDAEPAVKPYAAPVSALASVKDQILRCGSFLIALEAVAEQATVTPSHQGLRNLLGTMDEHSVLGWVSAFSWKATYPDGAPPFAEFFDEGIVSMEARVREMGDLSLRYIATAVHGAAPVSPMTVYDDPSVFDAFAADFAVCMDLNDRLTPEWASFIYASADWYSAMEAKHGDVQ